MSRATALPYLWVCHSRGRTFAYYRRGGAVRRVRDAAGNPQTPDMPGFLAAFSAMHTTAGVTVAPKPDAPPPGSLAALVDAYRASPEWRQLGSATRRNYAKALEPIREHTKAGLPAATLPRAFIFKLRDEYAMRDGKPTPRRSNHMGDVIRLLFAWGVNHGWRRDNPALRLGRLRTGPGYRQWTAADVALFRGCDAIPEPLRRACALGYYSGQRKQDCLAWLRSDRRQVAGGWVLFVKPLKTAGSTGKVLEIPEHPALTASLEASPHPESAHLLTRADGKPWGEDHFNHAFANAVKLAGLPAGSTFHGLRKALSAGLVEAGATDAELDAVAYHSDPRMTRHYRAAASQPGLARSAMAKLPLD